MTLVSTFKRVCAIGAVCVAVATPSFAETIIKSHGLSTYGDLKYPVDFKHLDYVNPDAPKGGEYSVWNIGTFDSMHPYVIKGRAAGLASKFFEPLMTTLADDPDTMYGVLAESVEYPEDRQWVIFNMRPEARFSDGTPVTADDIMFTYNILYNKGIPSLKTVLFDIVNVEVLDTLRVKFTFREGASTKTLPALVAGFPAFSRAHWEGKDFADSTLVPGLGSGPYILDKLDVGRSVVLKRDPNWWGKDLPINVGRYNFDTLREEYFGDATAAFEAFKAGALLFRTEGESKKWATGYDFPAVDKGWVKREAIPNGDLPVASGFFFNLRKDKFKDPRVREALGMMFNFEWSNATLFYDLYKRQDSFWENSPLEATGLPSAAEIALLEPLKEHFPADILTSAPVTPRVSGKGQLDRKIVRAASKLLDDAGWAIVDGKRMKDGQPLSVEFMLASSTSERFIAPFIDNMKRLGVEGSIALVDTTQFLERRGSHDFDVLTSRHVTYLTPDTGLRQWFGSKSADVDSRNFTGLKNDGIDALIDHALAATNREEMTTAIHALDRAIRSLRIWEPRWYKADHWVAYWDVYDHPETIPPYSLGLPSTSNVGADFWWWDQAKADKLRASGALR